MSQEALASSPFAREGRLEGDRLRVQARTWEPEAESMLDQVGLRPGAACADLGCGAMGVLGPLSRRVGPAGRVVGVDTDQRLLDAAAEYVKQEGLSNVELLNRDAYHTELPAESFDLVHERLVFCPAGDARYLLKEMLRLARPGGVVIAEEPDPSSWHLYPRSDAFEALLELSYQIIPLMGGDPRAGQKTFALFRDTGLQDVQLRGSIKVLRDAHPYMWMAIHALSPLRAAILEAGLTSEAELNRLVEEADARLRDPGSYMTTFTITQVWGRKP
ncbi:MAG TPA: methyltransferase domain-containing protein [Myxococcales bacterium]|nr:methyltransferase domain-containing protein [Myxococcales bacterium]